MHVCMYVCMHACMHGCMYVCMHVCMYYIYIRIYIAYIDTYICVPWYCMRTMLKLEPQHQTGPLNHAWVVVKELKLSCYDPGTILFTIYPYSGNLI